MKEKIRILHCVTAMDRGGLETLIMNYYRHIDRNKYDFDFLVQRDGKFEYSDEIMKLGGHIYTVPPFNPFNIRKYNLALDKFFADYSGKYDIVHAHNNSFAMYVLRSAKQNGFRVRIAHSHIAEKKHRLKKLPFVLYNKRKLKRVCNVRFACGREAGKWLFGDDSFVVIKNAIDLNIFAFSKKQRKEYRDKYNISDDTILLGHIGRFEKQKNHEFLIRIMQKAKEDGLNAKLLLIGGGGLESKIKKEVKDYGLEKEVIFVGKVENPQDYLNAMDVFVMPSLYEGLPVTLVEAQANGLPCVVSDTVSDECKITSLVSFVSLSDIDGWLKQIAKKSNTQRVDYRIDIKKSGYEIESATKRLENIYASLVYDDADVIILGDLCS